MGDVTVILTPLEAARFKSFQEYHETFTLLVNQGVFSMQFGKATLNFMNGQLQTITKEEVVYKRT